MSTSPPGPPPPVPPVPPPISVTLPPDMPIAWVQQVKDAVKEDQPSTLKTVLGSSLAAALIAAGTAVGTAHFTIKANSDLEKWKIEQAAQKEKQTELKIAYGKLDVQLSQLLEQVKGVSLLIQIAQGNRRLPGNIKEEFTKLAISERTILTLKADPNLPSEIWSVVDPPLGELASTINQAGTVADLRKFSGGEPKIETDLNRAITEVRNRKPK